MTNSPRKYKYTLGFIYHGDQILLLNRQKAPWMGRWNGVGGKLDAEESEYDCIVRETFEETGLHLPNYRLRGVMRWFRDGEDKNGVYLFTAEVTQQQLESYKTPTQFCHEGVLDWKKMEWVLHPENTGIVDNIQHMMKTLFQGKENDLYTVNYTGPFLQSFVYYPNGRLNPKLETS